MIRGLLILGLLGIVSVSRASGLPATQTVGSVGGDSVLRRVIVPSAEKPQGEVQIVRRDERLIVRTLLASRILKRVAAAIDEKEKKSWPETREGYAASLKYRDELFAATEKSWDLFRARSDRQDMRQFLAIEFILESGRGEILLSLPVVAGHYGQLEMASRQVISRWRAPVRYVRENMIEIVKDSFKLEDGSAEQMLAPLWPGP